MENGKGLETLYERIKVALNRKRLLECHYSKIDVRKLGNDIHWSLCERSDATPNGKTFKGVTFNKLKNKLDSIFKEEEHSIMPDVAFVLYTTANSVVYAIVEPSQYCGLKYKDEKADSISFEFKKLEVAVNEHEKGVVQETCLAFHMGGEIYPITEIAKSSIGKMLDAVGSFKVLSEVPMGSAILIAEKLMESRKVDILYEDFGRPIKPLLAVCSGKYEGYTQKEYFEIMFKLIADNQFIYNDKEISWSIEDGITTINIPLSGFSTVGLCYTPVIRMQSTDLPGASNKVELLAKVGDGLILLKSNAKYHQNKDVEDMFDGFKECIEDFDKKARGHYVFTKEDYKAIEKIVGKSMVVGYDEEGKKIRQKNSFKKVDKQMSISELVSDTWRILPKKQSNELMSLYKELVEAKAS